MITGGAKFWAGKLKAELNSPIPEVTGAEADTVTDPCYPDLGSTLTTGVEVEDEAKADIDELTVVALIECPDGTRFCCLGLPTGAAEVRFERGILKPITVSTHTDSKTTTTSNKLQTKL